MEWQVIATRTVRGGAKLRAATAAPGAADVNETEDAPEAVFDPDALLPRADIGPQLNEVRPAADCLDLLTFCDVSLSSCGLFDRSAGATVTSKATAVRCVLSCDAVCMTFASPPLQAFAKRLDHSSWKERNAALEALEEMVKAAGGRITQNLGEAVPALKVRGGSTANDRAREHGLLKWLHYALAQDQRDSGSEYGQPPVMPGRRTPILHPGCTTSQSFAQGC